MQREAGGNTFATCDEDLRVRSECDTHQRSSITEVAHLPPQRDHDKLVKHTRKNMCAAGHTVVHARMHASASTPSQSHSDTETHGSLYTDVRTHTYTCAYLGLQRGHLHIARLRLPLCRRLVPSPLLAQTDLPLPLPRSSLPTQCRSVAAHRLLLRHFRLRPLLRLLSSALLPLLLGLLQP